MFDKQILSPDRPLFKTGQDKQRIVDLVADWSIELTPSVAAKQESLAALLPRGTRVYIAFLPDEDYRAVAATATRLRAEGLEPVPHFPARTLRNRAQLDDYLARVTGDAGVDQVLVIGGGIDQPRGDFSGTLALLETGAFERHGIRAIGLAGHPEGQRDLPGPGVATTHDEKFAYAERTAAELRLVTQFVFEASPLIAWEQAIRAQGNPLPIHVGVPGPATIKSLVNYARLCGVGNSIRMLSRQVGGLFQLASLSYPDQLVVALAQQVALDPDAQIARLHFYPFGGLARTARWVAGVQAGAFTLNEDGAGFEVDPAFL